MNNFVYTQHQLRAFADDLLKAFVEAGFEVAEEPYIDYGLCGFRATYIRRYLLHQPTTVYDGILTTIIHTVGIPFGHNGQKMVILSAPRTLNNEPVSETLKLRLHFNADGTPQVVHTDQQQQKQQSTHSTTTSDETSNKGSLYNSNDASHNLADGTMSLSELGTSPSVIPCFERQIKEHFARNRYEHSILLKRDIFGQVPGRNDGRFLQDLAKYVEHIIEVISPGLIGLPTDMKLEILKQLSVDSIIKMSQVNNEFRVLIFKHGESLWRHLCYRDFNIKIINRLVHRSWMELYRDTYLIHQVEICRKERALPGLPERLALPPVPYREQIEWLPEILALPFHPLHEHIALPDNPLLALEFYPLHRADSLDSFL